MNLVASEWLLIASHLLRDISAFLRHLRGPAYLRSFTENSNRPRFKSITTILEHKVSHEDIQLPESLCLTIEFAMSAQLELSLRDSDPWIVAKRAFHLISDYVQPDSPISPGQVAQQLNNLSPGQRALQDGEEAEEPASFLLEFWETLVSIARQIPFDHPSQERLVKLVVSLDRLSPESDEAIVSSRHTPRVLSILLILCT